MIDELREKNPLVLCLTNFVVTNFTANVLLASGCSPIMSFDGREISELCSISQAVLINIGTLNEDFEDLIFKAIETLKIKNIPVVFDPVGSGATKQRTELTKKIINLLNNGNLIIKGNASEILSILDLGNSRGVDSVDSSDNVIEIGKKISSQFNCKVCITGKNDYIIKENGEKILKLSNGSKLLQKITGTGCALGGLIAGFSSLNKNNSIEKAISTFNIASEIAEKNSESKIGSFQIELLNQLGNIKSEEVKKLEKIIGI